ncbi:MAG: branched-chain amino acid aminotransferase [Pseudomonadota bacterium]
MAGPAFHDRDGKIWFDGELVDWRAANVHILTHAMHYASSVFEGERAYNGEIFKLREHTERLFESGRMLGFEIPYSTDEVDAASVAALEANGLAEAYVRPVAWRGSEMMGVNAQGTEIHLAVAAWEWPNIFTEEQRLKGVTLSWAPWKRPSPDTIPACSKAAGLYMICTLSKHDAEAKGFNDALMLDWRGYVAEATGANVFFVKGDAIHTPIPDAILDGITRRTVIGLAEERGFKVYERRITPDELEAFDECFLTGTAAEVSPVARIENVEFPSREAASVLMPAYTKLVRRES